jgi:hypothetical protein
MKKSHLFLVAIGALQLLGATSPAVAGIVSIAKIPSSGDNMIFELYDDAPLIPECRGKNASGALAKLEKESTKLSYGSGCWTADINGYVHLFIKSLDDGLVRETKIHNSYFVLQGSAESPTPEVQKLMKQEEELNDQCRGGSGDSPKTMAACEKRNKVFDQIMRKGWCWGSDGQTGYERSWVKCKR